MDTQKIINKNSVSLLLCGIVLGVCLAYFIDPYLPATVSNSKKNYQIGFNQAKKTLENSDLIRSISGFNVLLGKISNIEGNKVTISVKLINPFDDPSLSKRVFTVDDATLINKISITNGKAEPGKIKLSELNIGDEITVIPTQPTGDMNNFVAKEIDFTESKHF